MGEWADEMTPLGWDGLEALQGAGWEVRSHTVAHPTCNVGRSTCGGARHIARAIIAGLGCHARRSRTHTGSPDGVVRRPAPGHAGSLAGMTLTPVHRARNQPAAPHRPEPEEHRPAAADEALSRPSSHSAGRRWHAVQQVGVGLFAFADSRAKVSIRWGRFRGRLGTILIVVEVVTLPVRCRDLFRREPRSPTCTPVPPAPALESLDWSSRRGERLTRARFREHGRDRRSRKCRREGDVISSAARRFYDSLEPGKRSVESSSREIGIRPCSLTELDGASGSVPWPGWDERTFVPVGKVTAIAGHRTTFGAPFRTSTI